jgi:hypothetical protein
MMTAEENSMIKYAPEETLYNENEQMHLKH